MDKTRATNDLAWHFLPDDGRLAYPPHTKIAVGLTLTADGELVHCEDAPNRVANGLHYSYRALDALGYAMGSLVERVRLSEERIDKRDKGCARGRTTLWMGDATRVLHEFACWCAEDILGALAAQGYEFDPRSLSAIAVKRLWLDGKATDDELAAARAAAWDAARAAAWAAARAAARAAAWAAAWDAAYERYNAELERRLIEAFAPAEAAVSP